MRTITILLFLSINIVILASTDLVQLGNLNDDKGAIFTPDQVIEGPDANIYVYDAKDSYIKIFSTTGTFIRTICGPGEGPGFIKRSDSLRFGFTPGKLLYIAEYFGGHPWLSLLKTDGSFVDAVKPNIANNRYGFEQVSVLPDGSYIIEFSFIGSAEKKGNFFLRSSPHTIYHMDMKGNVISKIKETNYFTRISYLPEGGDLGIPYAPYNYWAPFEKDSILFTDGMDNYLLVIDFNGKIIRKIDTELPEVPPITERDLTFWRSLIKSQYSQTQSGKEWYKKYGKVIEEYKDPVYEKKAYINSLQVTGEGNILISSALEFGSTTRNFWLLNRKGKILERVILDVFEMYIFPHYIFVKKIDSDDNVLVYSYKRGKDEVSDFRSLAKLLQERRT